MSESKQYGEPVKFNAIGEFIDMITESEILPKPVIILNHNDSRRGLIEEILKGNDDIILLDDEPISVPFEFKAPVDRKPRNRKERRQGRLY